MYILVHKKNSKYWDIYTMSSAKRTRIIKQAITSKLIYKHMFPIKIITGLSKAIDKLMLKFIWKSKGPRQFWRISMGALYYYLSYEATGTGTMWHWYR